MDKWTYLKICLKISVEKLNYLNYGYWTYENRFRFRIVELNYRYVCRHV